MGSCTYRVAIFSSKFIVSFISTCLLVVPVVYAQTDSTRKVLILNSYHKEFKWTDAQVSAAKEALSEGIKDLELFVEYMDTKRIYNKEYLEYLFHIYRLKYKKVQLDAIITTDDNALWFVVEYHKEIFGESPVPFCGINDYKKSLLEGKQQFTGLLEVLDIKPTIDLALKLHPKTRKIVVIVDSTPTGLGQIRDITEGFHPTVTVKTNLDTDLLNISGSHAHIRKVVMNLVSNASEAIEVSGNVTISTMNRYVDRPLKGYDNVNIGEYAVLSVSDVGPGISTDSIERIFEPFYTKKVHM